VADRGRLRLTDEDGNKYVGFAAEPTPEGEARKWVMFEEQPFLRSEGTTCGGCGMHWPQILDLTEHHDRWCNKSKAGN
jgi:hypothetical protein